MSKTVSVNDLRWMPLASGGWATDELFDKEQVLAIDLVAAVQRECQVSCFVETYSAQKFYLFVGANEAPGQHTDGCWCPTCNKGDSQNE